MLGPVEIAWDGRPVDIGGVKARALVARLLIDRHIIVSVDRLVDSLWADHDGPGARDRDALDHLAPAQAPARGRRARGRDRDAGPGLRARGAGRDDRRLPARTPGGGGPRRSWPAGARASASGCSSEAEGLWRGPAYSEVRDEPFARAEARRLEELRLLGHRDQDRRRAHAGPARGGHGRAGDVDQRQPDARAAVVAAHAGALPVRAARPRRCGCSRTCAPSWWPSWGSSRGTT